MDLLGRARKLIRELGPTEPPTPQFYRVGCPEGHVLRGQRTESYQALRCPACGQGVFVLPRSTLPEPPAPSAAGSRRRRVEPAVVDDAPIELTEAPPQVETTLAPNPDVEIEWEDEAPSEASSSSPATVPAPPPRPRPAPASAPRPVRAGQSRPLPAPPRPGRSVAGADLARTIRVERESWRRRIARHRVVLAMLAVSVLVLATVGVRVWRSRIARLPEVAQTNREEGLKALSAAQFDLARQKLDVAADALETLGDPDAASVRQAAGEAAVFADLVGRGLDVILDQVATRADGPEWFQTLYRGRSILVDDTIAADSPRSLNLLIMAGRRRGRISLEGFSLLDGKKPGDPVTFGARLRAVRLGGDNVWQFLLEPDSGVFLNTDEGWDAYHALGGPPRGAFALDENGDEVTP